MALRMKRNERRPILCLLKIDGKRTEKCFKKDKCFEKLIEQYEKLLNGDKKQNG